jgi:hypothetical protein
MICMQSIGVTTLSQQALKRPGPYFFAAGGSSISHGHVDTALILPVLFLMNVIFTSNP